MVQCALAAIHRGMKMVRGIEMCAVVGREVDLFNGPALSVRKIFFLQAFEELQDRRQSLLMIDVLDGGMIAWGISWHIVLQGNGNIDQPAGHRSLLARATRCTSQDCALVDKGVGLKREEWVQRNSIYQNACRLLPSKAS